MDILNAILAVLSFVLGLVWAVVWFLLRDMLSTLLWLGIAVWLVVSVRYRSFAAGSLAMLRYGRLGLRMGWRWLRGGDARAIAASAATGAAADRVQLRRARKRVPFGYMSVSTQLNILVVAGLALLRYA
jgi:hypothetical protein